jgi:hypothetical protein
VSFIDVLTGEDRWILASTIEDIVTSEEFIDSFKPPRNDHVRVYLRGGKARGSWEREFILSPEAVFRGWNSVESSLPGEPFKVVVSSLYDESCRAVYYNVSMRALKYIVLNGMTYIQLKCGAGAWPGR